LFALSPFEITIAGRLPAKFRLAIKGILAPILGVRRHSAVIRGTFDVSTACSRADSKLKLSFAFPDAKWLHIAPWQV
jgi:hypothetical protein